MKNLVSFSCQCLNEHLEESLDYIEELFQGVEGYNLLSFKLEETLDDYDEEINEITLMAEVPPHDVVGVCKKLAMMPHVESKMVSYPGEECEELVDDEKEC